MDIRTKTVAGETMRWVEHGEGFPVVLLHGIPTSPTLWRKVMPLVSGARMLAWEMVGYGESIPEGEGRDLSLVAQAERLRAWMRALNLQRAVFVGHDLGGGVAQIAAVQEPGRCAGLVLTNAVGYDSWPIPSVRLLRRTGPVFRRLPRKAVQGVLRGLMTRGHDDPQVARESLWIHYAPYARYGGTRAMLRQMRALRTEDTLAVVDGLRSKLRGIPAKIVWGAADPFQKVRYAERFARDLDCELVRIEGGKHFTPEDHPVELARAIEEVVARASTP